MTILKFVTQDELDDLPEDHAMAFMTLVNHAQRRLDEMLRLLDPDDRYQWNQIEELRHGFMNVVVASAKRLEIEPFVSMQVPRLDEFNDKDHRQFKSDVDHYVTQLMLDNSIRTKRDSVPILPKSKDRIRGYVHGLRQCIDNSQMTDAKREALLNKLDDFERELEKRRLNLLSVTRVILEVLAIPGGAWASAELVPKLASNIIQTVAEMKAADDETRALPPVATPKALSPPRKAETPARVVPSFADDLNDDVPF